MLQMKIYVEKRVLFSIEYATTLRKEGKRQWNKTGNPLTLEISVDQGLKMRPTRAFSATRDAF